MAIFCGTCSTKPEEEPLFSVKDLPSAGKLRSLVQGELVLFGEEKYEAARVGGRWSPETLKVEEDGSRKFDKAVHATETWNLDAMQYPSAICTVVDATDIQACVQHAAYHGVRLCVAGGRHSHCCMLQDSLVIDLSSMRTVTVDPIKKTALVEGGALNGDVNVACAPHKLAVTLGTHPGTGIGGLTLQGGHGHLEKMFGLTVDSLLSVEVVTADGSLLKCSAAENQELFWALRGGCGNFGVAVKFEMQLHELPEKITHLQQVHLPVGLGPLKSRKELIQNWGENLKTSQNNQYSMLVCAGSGSMAPVITDYYCFVESAAEGEKQLEQCSHFGKPVAKELKQRSYWTETTWDIFGPSNDGQLSDHYHLTSALLWEMNDEVASIMADFMGPRSVNATNTLILAELGGKASEVAKDATAVWHRDAKVWAIIETSWKARTFSSLESEREKAKQWARDFRDALAKFSVGRYGQIEDMDLLGDGMSHATWGQNYNRLQKIKAKYDPANFFNANDNIKPASVEE
jgi:hypothetical protein